MKEIRATLPVRVADGADSETKRISRKRRARKRDVPPAKEERRRKKALTKEHPVVKERVVVKEVAAIPPKPPEPPRVLTREEEAHRHEVVHGACGRFLRDSQRIEERPRSKGWRRWLHDRHKKYFPKEVLPANAPPRLIEMKCAYELLRRGYVAAGEKIPEKIFRNMEAARTMSLEGFHDKMREMLESDPRCKPDEGVQAMAKEPKEKKQKQGTRGSRGYTGKGSGLKAHEYWVKLFSANSKEKLTDEQIASAMSKEFPNAKRTFDVALVRQHRSIYNAGRFRSQTEAPSKQSVPYAADGSELPLRYRVAEGGKIPKSATKPEAPKATKDRGKKVKLRRVKKTKAG